ncbi:MAG: serine hydrolase, partial [Gemmatimonadota bacterium]
LLNWRRPQNLAAVLDSLVARADSADLVIVVVSARVRAGAGTGAIETGTAEAFTRMAEARPLVLVSLGNPYLIQGFPDVGTYLLGWSGAEASQTAVARALLGRTPVAGRLPISIPPSEGRGDGLRRRVAAFADAVGSGALEDPGVADSTHGAALDSLSGVIEAAIAAGVTPGAVVAVGTSRGGVRIRASGRTGWGGNAPVVTDSTVYDIASLTKVVGTASAVMRLVDTGRLSLDAPLSRHLPAWPTGGWRDRVTIRRLLTHRAGLPGFVRFWHPAEGGLRGDSAIVAAIADLEPAYAPGTRYLYSDPGFILLGAAVEAVADTTLDAFLASEVFGPLGMHDTGFNPAGAPGVGVEAVAAVDTARADRGPAADTGRAALDRIAPTEVDTVFRHTHVHGQVHDENAWAMGGVAGQAGLFSTAPDLARFAHTLLRAGRAGEVRVFEPATVAIFTERQPGTERGLGWDVTEDTGEKAGTEDAEEDAGDTEDTEGAEVGFSASAFGHTGFTGTSLWIDPERDLYVILLTNRVNPTRDRDGIEALRRAVYGWAIRAVDAAAPLTEAVDSPAGAGGPATTGPR